MPYTPLDQSRVLWDASGRPYWASLDGRSKHYIPPATAAQYNNDPRLLAWAKSQGFELQRDAAGDITGMNQAPGAGAGGNRPLDFRTGRQWDPKTGRYDTDFDWGDIITLIAGGIAGNGVAAAAGAGGGGGGAAGSIAAPTAAESQAGIASMAGSGMAGGTAGGTSATLGGAAVGAGGAPLGGVMPAAASAGSGSAIDKLRDALMSPEGIATAASLATGMMAGDGTTDQTRATEEQARRLQAITEARMRRVDPLHEAATQLAFGRMPVNSRQGLALPRVALPREG